MKRSVMMMIGVTILALCLVGPGWASSTPDPEQVQITGTVLQGGLLVDDQGQEYQTSWCYPAPEPFILRPPRR